MRKYIVKIIDEFGVVDITTFSDINEALDFIWRVNMGDNKTYPDCYAYLMNNWTNMMKAGDAYDCTKDEQMIVKNIRKGVEIIVL